MLQQSFVTSVAAILWTQGPVMALFVCQTATDGQRPRPAAQTIAEPATLTPNLISES